MELHLHLSVAFRALDRKWGTPIDLETPVNMWPCLPAMVDRSTTTFSSEEYLKARRRLKPYSRTGEKKRKENIKGNDSFSLDISSRMPSVTDLEELSRVSGYSSSETLDSISSSGLDRPVSEYVEDYEDKAAGSTMTLDSVLQESKTRSVFKRFKDSAKSFVDKKIKRNC